MNSAFQWFTTEPNPCTPATGVDAGQRGWRLHAVRTSSTSFSAIKSLRAVCGLRPSHGWGLDLFIDDKCRRCSRVVARVEAA